MKHSGIVYLWALVIAVGGFLFGFDTAVISGAEQAIQHYWSLSTFQLGFTVAIALIGTVIGALCGRECGLAVAHRCHGGAQGPIVVDNTRCGPGRTTGQE